MKDVLRKMIMQLEICCLHVGQYQWINHAQRLDLIMSNPDVSCVICTDFGATLDLHACEKDNISVDNHAVICILFVLTDWRRVRYFIEDKRVWDETIVNNYDKWIIFGDTLSKGKQQSCIPQRMSCLPHKVL